MNNKFIIDLRSSPDIFGQYKEYDFVGVNQLYLKNGHKLSPQARDYKTFIASQISQIKIQLKMKDDIEFDPNKKLFLFYKFYVVAPLTKKWVMDQRNIRDPDNLFKPIQDALESNKKEGFIGLRENDKVIQWVLGVIEYNKYSFNRIECSIKTIDNKLLKQIDTFF